MEKIAAIILKHGFNVVKVYTPETISGDKGHLVFILENCTEDYAKKLVDEIKINAPEVVLNISGVSSSNGILFLPFKDIVFGDRRACVLTSGMVREMGNVFLKDPSTASMGKIWLRSLGEAIGRQIYRGWIKYVYTASNKWEENVKNVLQHFVDIYHALGFGELEVVEVSGLKYRVVAYRNIFCSAFNELKVVQKCGFINEGILTGLFREIFGRRTVVNEKECVCMNRDKCIYEIELYEPEYVSQQ